MKTPYQLFCRGQFVGTQLPDSIVYLHGFRSSPQSVKAKKVLADFRRLKLAQRLWVPKLPDSPWRAISTIKQWAKQKQQLNKNHTFAFIGSSLGGLYATWLGEAFPGAKVVLLNPAVNPSVLLSSQVGIHPCYSSNDTVNLLPIYLKHLKRLESVAVTDSSRYFLVAAEQDEVLSHQQMVKRYDYAHLLNIKGGDHALSEFDEYWPYIRLFLGLA